MTVRYTKCTLTHRKNINIARCSSQMEIDTGASVSEARTLTARDTGRLKPEETLLVL